MKPFASSIPRWLMPCLLASLFLSAQAFAQTPPAAALNPPPQAAQPAYVGEARKAIDAVLAEPVFDRTQTVKVPKLKADGKKNIFDKSIKRLNNEESQSEPRRPFDASAAAQFGEIVLWLLVFGLVVLLIVSAKRWLPFFGWRRGSARPARNPVLQSDSALALESVEALPEEIAAIAERCWREGKAAEALSLLYRGTLKLMATRHRVELPQGATEEEIRLLVGSALPACKDDFGRIARAWLILAYAHRPPADFDGLLAGFGRLQQAGGAAP
ncbi:MAG: hypothetical protein LBU76_10550 [Azoarcus sp.]|jgi:hypothetical protein|nr:hypothetical protein [Azoarcus sp.]